MIIKIKWNRIYLEIEFDKKIDDDIYLVNNKNEFKICSDYINDNKVKMPITCAYSDTIIDSGKWNIKYKGKIVSCDIECAKTLDDMDKVFFYKNRDYAYIVTFEINDDFSLIMNVNFMKKNKNKKSNKVISSNKPLLQPIINFLFIIFTTFLKLYYNLIYLFSSRKKNKILFISETRSPISGNLLALSNRIKERNLDKDYKLYYSFKRVLSERKSIIYYLKVIYKIAKVDYIFVDDYAPIFGILNLHKTKLIQVWHAGVGFKSVGYSRFGKDGSPHPLISPHKKYDYVSVAAPNLVKVYQEVFGLTSKHFIAPGMLRLDGYLDSDRIKSIKEKLMDLYPFIKNKKVILFAPTYRGTGQADAYYDYDKLDLDKLYKLCRDKNYITLFKYHPFIKKKMVIDDKYKDYLIDISDYKDINELFYITDILITDYSSNIYEYSLFERPIIFFDYDMDVYSVIRGVHSNLEESPGNVCKTFDEVINTINNERFDLDKVKRFKNDNILLTDSSACDRLIKQILDK